MAELRIAHRCGQIAEEEGGRLLVIPYVGAAAMAATSLVVTPFKTEKATILGAKAGLRAQVRQIEQGGLFDDGWQIAVAEALHKTDRGFLQLGQGNHHLLGNLPGILVSSGVVVADALRIAIVTAGFFGVRLGGIPGHTIGEMPGQ